MDWFLVSGFSLLLHVGVAGNILVSKGEKRFENGVCFPPPTTTITRTFFGTVTSLSHAIIFSSSFCVVE